MKISTAKTEIVFVKAPCPVFFPKNGATLQQMKKFKYLGVTFSNDDRQGNKLDTSIGKANAIMYQLY